MKQKHQDFIFHVLTVSLVEILCAIGLMSLAAWLYVKAAKICKIELDYKPSTRLVESKQAPRRGDT